MLGIGTCANTGKASIVLETREIKMSGNLLG
jgi:hypothetical protein